jgi:hypothetical protein
LKAELTYTIKLLEENGDVAMPVEPQKALLLGISDLTEKSNDLVLLPGGAEETEYNFGMVNSASLLFIRTTETISIRKETEFGEVWNIVADKTSGDTKYGILLLTTSQITKLFLSNPGSETAKVQIIIAS